MLSSGVDSFTSTKIGLIKPILYVLCLMSLLIGTLTVLMSPLTALMMEQAHGS